MMSIQVSTRIDETTKRQFDKVCADIGISPSNALSMFIKGVINYNGIPFEAVASSAGESSTAYKRDEKTAVKPPPPYGSALPYGRGCMKGKIWMAEDFDAPLDDFAEYME